MRGVLVTGGAGFIGSHLATALVERGDRVRVLDNLSTGSRGNLEGVLDRIELIEGDVRDADCVARAVKEVDCIFHQAALASVPLSVERPLDSHAVCATGTVMLLDQARRAGVRRVVYAASSSAYGDRPSPSKRETDLPEALSPYAAAKLAAEFYCQAFYRTYGLETVCLRYFNVFGPRQDPASPYSAVIPIFLMRLLAGTAPVVYGDGMQSRDFVYVGDVVQANVLAAESPKAPGQTFNVGSGRSISLLELIGALSRLLDIRVEPIHEPPRAGDVRDSLADITLARELLGYAPRVGLEEGLRLSLDYYRELAAR